MKPGIRLDDLNHHAYYIVGGDSVCADLVAILSKQHKIKIKGNPDFSLRKYDVFTIDDARALKAEAETRPASADEVTAKKIFIVRMNGITIEAQNALLKLLEEPAAYVHFFLVIPSPHLLLPTIKSRISLIEHGKVDISGDSDTNEEAAAFICMSVSKRLDYIKKLMDDIAKEKKTKQDALNLLNAIERVVYEKEGVKKAAVKLGVIVKARSYMNDRGPSFKMLLEYVALNI